MTTGVFRIITRYGERGEWAERDREGKASNGFRSRKHCKQSAGWWELFGISFQDFKLVFNILLGH